MRALIDAEGSIIHHSDKAKGQIFDVFKDFAHVKGRSCASLAFSIESKDCPFDDEVRKKHVRCDLKFGGYFMRDIGDNKCKATYVVCMDLKGWIPPIASNLILPQQASNVLKVKALIERLLQKMYTTPRPKEEQKETKSTTGAD